MAQFKSNHKKTVRLKPDKGWFWDILTEETKQNIVGVVFFVLSFILILSYFNTAGVFGRLVFRTFDFLLGLGYFLLPGILVVEGIRFFRARQSEIRLILLSGGFLIITSVLGLMDILKPGSGGIVGKTVGILENYLGALATSIVYLGILLIGVLILSNQSLLSLFIRKKKAEEENEIKVKIGGIEEKMAGPEAANFQKTTDKDKTEKALKEAGVKKPGEEKTVDLSLKRKVGQFHLPPLSLLERDSLRPSAGDIKANANIIKRTLENFGIPVEMAEVNIGPTVTQYTLKPAQGVKLSKIISLQNDLSLALAAHPIRVEAPIPGKSLIGIEIPNKSAAVVRLGNLLANENFAKSSGNLNFPLGRDVTGTPIYTDLVKFPHLLIAGSTGSGKSVFIHSIILTLLFRHTPQSLNLVLIDPKRVELSSYNKIPHLLSPVITDGKKSVAALHWLLKEMDRRYDVLLEAGARDVESYNQKVFKSYGDGEKIPYIVLFIDELADLMAAYGREVEGFIVRLAQMSRATGIHLVISTQRPSVEVITGLIKANIPARVAFQVASQVDSRTILDMGGAEKLLGSGDMLFLPPESSKPKRLQGPFLSEKEIKKVVDFWSRQSASETTSIAGQGLNEEFSRVKTGQGILNGETNNKIDLESYEDEEDELYSQALGVVMMAKKASASLLQRRLKVGYARAARLLDILEAKGIIGPGDGAKPRKILIDQDEADY